jgi:hypothetical protein
MDDWWTVAAGTVVLNDRVPEKRRRSIDEELP